MTGGPSLETKRLISRGHAELESFHAAHPDFDLLGFDFYSPDATAELPEMGPALQARLQAQQRVLRITPYASIARKLLDSGFDSAHRIAAMPEHKFLRQHAHLFADEETARAVHRRAGAIKGATKHVYANLQGMLASHHYKALRANNVTPEVANYFENMPSYQDLFGSLNYCTCQDCASIFGPAAYFLDLMRITDDYITDPNISKASDNIPSGYRLDQRRPDLFDLPLTCAATNDLVPTLSVVNQILARNIGAAQSVTSGTATAAAAASITLAAGASSQDGAYDGMWIVITAGTGLGQLRAISAYVGATKVASLAESWKVNPDTTSQYVVSADPYQTVAAAPYPFNLPANLPLIETRRYLAALKTNLAEIYTALNAPVNSGTAQAGSSQSLTLAASASSTSGAYLTMRLTLTAGAGVGQSRTVTAYDGSSKVATVDPAFSIVPDATTRYVIEDSLPTDRELDGLSIEQYAIVTTPLTTDAQIAPYYGLDTIDLAAIAHVKVFLERTGLVWDELQFLLTQGLSASELEAGVAETFFINATGESLPAMRIATNTDIPDAPYFEISDLSLLRLDRLNRLIRLAAALRFDYASLDWAMKSIGASEIDEAAIKSFAGIERLRDGTELDVSALCSFWAPMKTIGKGDGLVPADLFDRVFNSPALLREQNPYTSVVPIPFDPSRPLTWTIADTSGESGTIRSRLLGALNIGDDDLTRVALFVIAFTGSSSGTLALSLDNLTWLYRLVKAASIFGLSVDAYLLLIGLMYFPSNPLGPPVATPVPTVATVLDQKRLVDWFTTSPFSVYSALYILTGIATPFFTPAYRPDDVAPFVQNLATVSAGSRLTPQSFVFGAIEAVQAERIFAKLVETAFLTPIGILESQAESYRAAAAEFPLDAQSFTTDDITPAESAIVFQELQEANPPILIRVVGKAQATVAQHVTVATPLDFLFPGQEDAPNKRNEVLAILMATKSKIHFAEFSFVFPILGDSFVSSDITPAQSERSFEALAAQSPPLVRADPANGQSGIVKSYDGKTRTATMTQSWTTAPDRASAYAVMQAVISGTAQGGTITTITLAGAASAQEGAYAGMRITLTGGTGSGETATIVAYDGASRAATIAPAWVAIPDTTSTYDVAATLAAGIAVSGTSTTITLDPEASASDDAYVGTTIELRLSGLLTTSFSSETELGFLFTSTGEGQSATISAYDGPTRTATVATAWSTVPDATSVYRVIRDVTQGTAQGGGEASIVLAAAASDQDGAYNGMTIALTAGTGAGESGTIFSYDGASRTATLQAPWTTIPDATSVYAVTEILTQGTARTGGASTIALAADASPTIGAYDGMTVAIIADPAADAKRGEVKETLRTQQQNITHTYGVFDAADALQQGNAMQGLADLLGTTSDRLRVLIPMATYAADLVDYLDDLLTPIEDGQVPPELPPFIAALSRGVVLFDTLAYTIPQMLAVVEIPQAFAIGDPRHLTLDDLASLTLFKVLVRLFGDQSDRLIDYLRRPPDATCPGPTTLALSALTHWPPAQICTLEALFWPDGIATAPRGPGTVWGLSRLEAGFALSTATGLDIGSLLRLDALGTLPVAAGGKIIPANWTSYTAMASLVLAAVNAKYGDADFTSVNSGIVNDLNEQRRDALLGFTIWLLQKTYPDIVSVEALYEYLLIDVEMSGCDETSYIAQGIASVQLYMQRCRLMLERGVTDMSQIPEIWWEWMSAYRIWEANRKIFLYPENYIEPALRTDKTPQFKELVDELMQTDISETSVTSAYQTYFQSFSTVAQLTNASAYGARLSQPGTKTVYAQGTATGGTANTIGLASPYSPIFNAYAGMIIKITGGTGAGQVNGIASYDGYGTATVTVPWTTIPDTTSTCVISGAQKVDTLFLVAHTNTQPPVYYARSFETVHAWSPWLQVKLSIPSPFVSPLYAFGKLFLFWVEQKTVDASQITSSSGNASSLTIADTTASLKFSYRAADGNWLAPQLLTDDIVVTYQQQYALDPYVAAALPGYGGYFGPQYIYWQKVYPLHVPAEKLTQPDQYPTGEQIFLNYGFGTSFAAGGPAPVPTQPSQAMPADQYQLEYDAYSMVGRYNTMVQAPLQSTTGFLQFQDSITLDGSLAQSSLDTALLNYLAGLNPQPYFPSLTRSANTLSVALSTNWNLVLTDYLSDDYPASATNASFAGTGVSLLANVSGKTASVVTVKNIPGSFIFDNADEAFLVRSSDRGILPISDVLIASASLVPFPSDEFYLQSQTFTTTVPAPALSALKFSFERITTTVARSLMQRLLRGGIPDLLSFEAQLTPEPPFSRLQPNGASVTPPPSDRLDFNGAYGLYFWEVFFYAPFLVADSLRANQRFREAKDWFEYIYNPTQQPEGSGQGDADRYWRFLPFRDMTIETLTQILANPAQIAAYNDDPFDPDAIARLRTVAYAKAIVMKYIANLLSWGDFLFTQDTRETINQATNLYVMASDLLGPRPIAVGACETPAPMSFNAIKQQYTDQTIATGTAAGGAARSITLAAAASSVNDAYTGYYVSITAGTGSGQTGYITAYAGTARVASVDPPWQTVPDATSQYRVFAQGIPQFLIRLENTPVVLSASSSAVPYSDLPFNDINSYFCVPENSELTAYWDLIEDRLFKIRHCMNIAGQVRPLALFEPPINPRDLIQAARSGGGSLGVASQLNMPIPYYRFWALLDRAKGLTAAVAQLGSALLAALEKRDAESLAMLRTSQEKTLLQLTTLIKEQQIEEVKQTSLALGESLKSAQKRQSYYTEQIDKGLSSNEIQNIVYMTAATVFNTLAAATRTMSAIGYAVPQVGSPFAMTYGGQQIGASLNAASGVLEGLGILANFGAQLNLTMAQYRRRESEWQLQADLAGFDVAQIQDQIAANAARQKIADRDLQVHLTSIAQNDAVAAFLKDKFTNGELYQWMATRLSVLNFQTYSLAIELARSVQRSYQYETGSDASFVNFGYWDNSRRGLLAGEGLMLALNQMEKSYIDRNARAYEIEKTVSLLQINPRALLDFIASGECIFELSEKLFDDDFPGQYLRRIKTIAVSIPAITGPYQNIHATLTQLSNQVIVKPDLNAVNYLLGASEATLPDAAVLRSNWWSNQSVVLSRGLSDNGLFETSGADERYLPFEGTGSVSTWRLSMPKSTNHFDFRSITDVILQLRYTAFDGGAKLRQDVMRLPAMRKYAGSDFFACAQRFSTQWYQFLEQPVSTTQQVLSMTLADLVLDHVGRAVLTGFLVQLVTPAGVDPSAPSPYITLKLGKAASVAFSVGRDGRYTHLFNATPRMADAEGQASVTFDLSKTPASLKQAVPPNYLDPAVLQNIVLTLFYDGEIHWP